MIKKIRKILNNERGFTLIELMVVLVILGILVSIATPRFVDKVSEAQAVKTQADLTILQNAVDLYYLDKGTYPADIEELFDEGYLRNKPLKVDEAEYQIIDGVVQ